MRFSSRWLLIIIMSRSQVLRHLPKRLSIRLRHKHTPTNNYLLLTLGLFEVLTRTWLRLFIFKWFSNVRPKSINLPRLELSSRFLIPLINREKLILIRLIHVIVTWTGGVLILLYLSVFQKSFDHISFSFSGWL